MWSEQTAFGKSSFYFRLSFYCHLIILFFKEYLPGVLSSSSSLFFWNFCVLFDSVEIRLTWWESLTTRLPGPPFLLHSCSVNDKQLIFRSLTAVWKHECGHELCFQSFLHLCEIMGCFKPTSTCTCSPTVSVLNGHTWRWGEKPAVVEREG